MRAGDNAVAILISDTHLSPTVPAARGETPEEWVDYQTAYLDGVRALSDRLSVPVVHAGDVFDSWRCTTEFINRVLSHAPEMYAIPGQHDLPNHRYVDLTRSAFWTLVEADLVRLIPPQSSVVIGRAGRLIALYGFPWGFTLDSCQAPYTQHRMNVAVAHKYVWAGDSRHATADTGSRYTSVANVCGAYEVVLFGDNHIGWDRKLVTGTRLFNHGTALRRHADERNLPVGPAVLYFDGSISRVPFPLPCMPEEKWADRPAEVLPTNVGVNADELLRLLSARGGRALSFRDAVAAALAASTDVPAGVRTAIREWLA